MATATKTTSKATHKGTCQVCGCVQKLPGGVLAKHGYTTKWGFFSGVCTGSGYRPFETHTDRVRGAIDAAKARAAVLTTQADKVRAEKNPDDCWVNAYSTNGGRGAYGFIRTRIGYPSEGATRFLLHYWHPGDDKPARWQQIGCGTKTLAQAVAWSNGRYADSLVNLTKQISAFVSWQTDRLKGWTPKPLIPIK